MNKHTKIIDIYGTIEFKLNEKLHHTDGPAVEYHNGDKLWYINGKKHRIDGPAVELADGHKEWWLNGKLHSTDGPAIERADGNKFWWINGKQITVRNYKKFVNDYPDLINQFLTYQMLNG